ncbi:hypothetical protein R83H12_00746 [Fibrobacteria bacterium R8-3-H12]
MPKNIPSRALLTAAIVLAIAFTLGCEEKSSGKSSSSTVEGLSSAADGSTLTDSRDGKKYKTIKIGSQTWMARNLNYNASGSKCFGDSPANCTKYGRLYDWATAMALPSSCNFSTCSSQISAKHRGICPAGWHIPSDAEWTTLTDYVGSSAERKLKARSGWNDNKDGTTGNGTDDYGFAALPGGGGSSDGSFGNTGYFGNWWSATEYDAGRAYSRYMSYYYYGVDWYYYKSFLFSVRCLQD